ncbi:ABC transporter permease [Achromobacter xylosoxidans]|uniref:ABC transporter permease n=1 Tax=Alcaligenes xylosoxydans xylosoxydans TaxID=85698 RepID=UPI000B254500|nr:ABC transporter permease [Achromobacter xylosoxidans]PWV42069.1 ABC transporter permease [Achromobacter xylosoxidans]
MYKQTAAGAVQDITSALKRFSLIGTLGWQDVRQRYRRSSLGAFWLTISMGVMIATIGIVFGQIFKSPMDEFLPFLSAGLVLWGFISTTITEGCSGFIAGEAVIKQLPIPLSVHVFRVIWRNLIILAHNIVIFPLVLVAVQKAPTWDVLMAIPGLMLLIINLSWIAIFLGIVCTRYRDIPQIISSFLQVVFYLTPIMWLPSLLPSRAGSYMLDLNPFYHFIQIVRAPLLDQVPSAENWVVSTGIAVVGWIVTLVLFGKYRRRIAYWL